jgi:hypothetical protein
MRKQALFLLLAMLALLGFSSQAWSQGEHTSSGVGHDGTPIQGVLKRLDEKGRLVLQQGDQQKVVESGQLAYWGRPAAAREGAWLLMSGGSRIVADLISWNEERVTVESRYWQQTTIPVASLRGIVFRPPTSAARQDRLLRQIQEHAAGEDLVFLRDGDILRGVVLGFSTMREILPLVRIRVAGQAEAARISYSRVQAVAFRHLPAGSAKDPANRWVVGFRDGSQLSVRSLKQQETELHSIMEHDLKLVRQAAPGGDAWHDVVYLRPVDPKTQYLSDLEPLGYKHIPYLGVAWSYQMDHGVTGGRLASGGVLYEKGIGMHSTSRLAFEVPANARWFHAEMGLDDSAGRRGSVVFLVYCQRATEEESTSGWEMVFQSEVVRGGDVPGRVRVSLEGVRRMALVVQHADRGDVKDHANWLQARITIKPSR